MADITVVGNNGVNAIVTPAVPANIVVSGLLKGDTGATGAPGLVQSITAADPSIVIAGTPAAPTVSVSLVPISKGGTGSTTQNFIDLTTVQNIGAGAAKTFGTNTPVTTAPIKIIGYSDTIPLLELGDGGAIYFRINRANSNALSITTSSTLGLPSINVVGTIGASGLITAQAGISLGAANRGLTADVVNTVLYGPTNVYISPSGTDGTRIVMADGTLRVGGPGQLTASLLATGSLKTGVNTYAKAAALNNNGEISLDNGTADSPGVHFYQGTNNNMSIDVAGDAMRFSKDLDEATGVVYMTIQHANGNVAITPGTLSVGGGQLILGNGSNASRVTAANGNIDMLNYDTLGNLTINSYPTRTISLATSTGDISTTQNAVTPFYSYGTGALNATLVLKTGKVGLGTTVPNELLDVNGTSPAITLRYGSIPTSSFRLRADNFQFQLASNSGTDVAPVWNDQIQVTGGTILLQPGNTGALVTLGAATGYTVLRRGIIGSSADMYIGESTDTGRFIVRGTGAATFVGNVGMGGQLAPGAKLDIGTNVDVGTVTPLRIVGYSNTQPLLELGDGGGTIYFRILRSAGNAWTLATQGNLTIPTLTGLTVSGNTSTTGSVGITAASNTLILNTLATNQYSEIYFNDITTTKWIIQKRNDNTFAVYDNALANYMFYSPSNSGFLGLWKPAPAYALDVAGKIRASNGFVKRINALTVAAAVYTPNADTTDIATISSPTAAYTIANATGTPIDGQQLMFRILSGTTAYGITWGSQYLASGAAALPTTGVASKTITASFLWDAVKAAFILLAVDSTGY
jgi:hypothetical protein